MPDIFYTLLAFGLFYSIQFGCIYLYGRKSFPKLALYLTTGTWLFLMIVTYYTYLVGVFFSVILMTNYLFILKKPSISKALKQFYIDNKIYLSRQMPQAALNVLGNKNWFFAEGTLNEITGETTDYLFWQGYTSSTVSTGSYSKATVFTNYIAFIFPPGTASLAFKHIAKAAANKNNRTFKQKIKYFFVEDYNTPLLATTATDGSFIIEYITLADVAHYTQRLNWIKANFSKAYFPANEQFILN